MLCGINEGSIRRGSYCAQQVCESTLSSSPSALDQQEASSIRMLTCECDWIREKRSGICGFIKVCMEWASKMTKEAGFRDFGPAVRVELNLSHSINNEISRKPENLCWVLNSSKDLLLAILSLTFPSYGGQPVDRSRTPTLLVLPQISPAHFN